MAARLTILSALGLLILASACPRCPAQEPGKSGDEALDSLIEKIAEPKSDAPKPEARPEKGSSERKAGDSAPAAGSQEARGGKPAPADVSGKDRELDELLEKLGESRDEPTAQGKPGGAPGTIEPGEPAGGGGDRPEKPKDAAKGPGLQGKDREIDERLEEFLGKRRKKNRQEQEDGGGGAMAEIVKEMRDVEQKLGKPETGEDTQTKQKQIVKRIETLIQQMKQSGSSGQMALKMSRQQGQKPGDPKPGQTPGANPGGAPPMKPGKPPERHAMAGGKDIWGHLPPELRQEMENVFKEDALPAKQDLIRRYYLSIAKQKLQRGE
jgi:hypothetical protein